MASALTFKVHQRRLKLQASSRSSRSSRNQNLSTFSLIHQGYLHTIEKEVEEEEQHLHNSCVSSTDKHACFLSLFLLFPGMPRPPSPPLSDDESLIPDVADLAQWHFGSLQKRAKKVSDFRSNHVWSSVPSQTASGFFFCFVFFFCTQNFYVIICSSAEGSRCFAAAGNGTKSRNPVKVI